MKIFLRVLIALTLAICVVYLCLYHIQGTGTSQDKHLSNGYQLTSAQLTNNLDNFDQHDSQNNESRDGHPEAEGHGGHHSHVSSLKETRVRETDFGQRSASARHKLILLTYMRSGSTLTGTFFDEHPGVFYIYEPLWTLRRAIDGLLKLRDSNGTEINITGNEDIFRLKGVDTMRSLLHCHLENLDPVTLTQVHMKRSRSSHNYSECLKISWDHDGRYREELVRRLPSCMNILTSKCMKSKVTAIKVIEASMAQTQAIMATDSRVKVLHLIRDPRGVINSRKLFGIRCSLDPGYIRSVCLRVLEDINTSLTLSKMFPGRILTVRYEDIVSDPIMATQQMYEFVGLRLSSRVKKRIWDMTSAGFPDDCNVCPVRSNATETANSWRRKLDFPTVATIQGECHTLLALMGYRSFRSEDELRNYDVSSTFGEYDSRMMKVSVKGITLT